MIQIFKNNSGGKMQLAIFWSESSHLHIRRQKSDCLLYCYPIYICSLWRHSYLNSNRKLTVSYSDPFKRLINVPRYTSSSLHGIFDERNWPYQCGVPQICLLLDQQSNSFLQQYCYCHSQQWWISSVCTDR